MAAGVGVFLLVFDPVRPNSNTLHFTFFSKARAHYAFALLLLVRSVSDGGTSRALVARDKMISLPQSWKAAVDRCVLGNTRLFLDLALLDFPLFKWTGLTIGCPTSQTRSRNKFSFCSASLLLVDAVRVADISLLSSNSSYMIARRLVHAPAPSHRPAVTPILAFGLRGRVIHPEDSGVSGHSFVRSKLFFPSSPSPDKSFAPGLGQPSRS
ncbi:hypothetical protein C8R45DRAFT_1222667 [Mycena sanguinolenta]|nr:hypothetical protein C8R45DRAFT_1222667 [Mycena sanguinolenta]